jgi:hypothetical protein
MATLSEVTQAHSLRINAITRAREEGFRRASAERDDQLRAIPAAARLYDAFDAQVTEARSRQSATESKAQEARAAALQAIADRRSDGLDEAHRRRNDVDAQAFDKKRRADEAAEKKFVDALAANPTRPSIDAQRTRAAELERARQELADALKAAQERHRADVDDILMDDRRGTRDADRAFHDAIRIGESALRIAESTAEQALARALTQLPEAAALLEQWRKATARVAAEYKRAENVEMARFHDELQALS